MARQIIEKGLMAEYGKALLKIEAILIRWKQEKLDNKEVYNKIYDRIITFDKHIGSRYNNLSASNYLYILAGQLFDGFITLKDIEELDEVFRNKILLLSSIGEK